MDEEQDLGCMNDGASRAPCTPRTPRGLTADCVRVQHDLLELRELLENWQAGGNGQLLARCERAVRDAEDDLCEHRARIEGSGGLFQYISEGAPQFGDEVCRLCAQHGGLALCLARLDKALLACEGDDRIGRTRVTRCVKCLKELMRLHQSCAEEFLGHVSTA